MFECDGCRLISLCLVARAEPPQAEHPQGKRGGPQVEDELKRLKRRMDALGEWQITRMCLGWPESVGPCACFSAAWFGPCTRSCSAWRASSLVYARAHGPVKGIRVEFPPALTRHRQLARTRESSPQGGCADRARRTHSQERRVGARGSESHDLASHTHGTGRSSGAAGECSAEQRERD